MNYIVDLQRIIKNIMDYIVDIQRTMKDIIFSIFLFQKLLKRVGLRHATRPMSNGSGMDTRPRAIRADMAGYWV